MTPQLLTLISGMVGAFAAAWFGAQLAFRRTRKERALDRRVDWHAQAVEALAEYEDALESLHRHSRNAVLKSQIETAVKKIQGRPAEALEDRPLPRKFRSKAAVWERVTEAEARARAALRTADVYTEGKTQLKCSTALRTSVNLVTGYWFDVSDEPEIPWAGLSGRIIQVEMLRRDIQESMRVVLELDGFLARVLGEGYRRKKRLRELDKLRKELDGDRRVTEKRVPNTNVLGVPDGRKDAPE